MLLAFQKTIIWHSQSLYEVGGPSKAKRDVVDAEFGSMTSEKLWTLDNTLLNLFICCILLRSLIAFQNAKAILI